MASTIDAFAALITPPPSSQARLSVLQEDDDKLALRVDDETDDSTYFFIDYEGRARVNSSVLDDATETFAVNGASLLRGDVFLDDSELSLQEQLDEKLTHSDSGMSVQTGKTRLHWNADSVVGDRKSVE